MKYPQIYIDEMYETGGGKKCPACKSPAVRSLCEKHLRKVKLAFREWVKRRYSKGKCYQCNRNRLKVEQRCWHHKEINRRRCFKWARSHKAKLRERYHMRKSLL